MSHTDARRPGRVLVAMSGGVDSAVAATRLLEQGWDVGGVTFKLFCYDEAGAERKACCGLEGVRDAQGVARRLGFPHTVLDLSELFRERVLDDFVGEYARGRTPNPCVQCNTHVKFAPLLSFARRNGYDAIATGHYARIRWIESAGARRPLLETAADAAKDQTYVLWGVPPAVLADTLFPLGDLSKDRTRALARTHELPVWDKEESQDVCFVDGRGYAAVVEERLEDDHPLRRPGVIRTERGAEIGRHPGLLRYTIGQRRGLPSRASGPWHVTRLDAASNTLIVGEARDLLSQRLEAEDLNLFVPPAELAAAPVQVRIRYRHEPAAARASVEAGRMLVTFDEPQRAVAPGQSCVVYRDGLVLAGGRIAIGATDPSGGTA
jgi:tRNA-specific 2-thiouridylase